MSSPGADAARFRARITVAMMFVVAAITVAALYFAQRNAEANAASDLQHEFQSRLGFLLGAQEARLAAIATRCRRLAKSVRIRAALEEDDREDLYRNALIELRDVIEEDPDESGAPDEQALRAQFFRFLDVKGAVIPQPEEEGATSAPSEAGLALVGASDRQQLGYVLWPTRGGREVIHEVIATPIITTDSGEAIGSLVLGFKPLASRTDRENGGMKSGVWLKRRLYVDSVNDLTGLTGVVAQIMSTPDGPNRSLAVNVDGAPHLLFARLLNPKSEFPAAYQVCLFPLAESIARQRTLRWQIVGAGALLFFAGLAATGIISGRLAAPIERLVENSAENYMQRELAEAAMALSEEKYRSIFENAVEGIFITTPSGRYLSANPALARMYGYDTPEALMRDLKDVGRQLYVEPGRRQEFVVLMRTEGAVRDFESEVRRHDGRIIWISENARQVRNSETSELLYYEGTVQDITERKRAADELLALNAELQSALSNLKSTQQQVIQQERLRALGQMASGIAHDFNNALVPILGFSDLLLISPAILADHDKATKYLETIQTAAKDAASVVSRLREFYRPDKNHYEFAPVNLKRLVEQSITLTKPKWKDQAQASGATIEIALELEPVPAVSGEESALREAFTNLIFNAVDAMPEGGKITLRTHREGDFAIIEVADTGTGMTEETRRRCLEPFYSTKGERGTGLGLSMVFGIVQRHSGSLDLQSEVGKGTTFIIKLPLQEAGTIRQSSATATAIQRPLRVLVVDDEAPVRDTLAAVLAADGHDVVLAQDGAEGLRRFGGEKFDLIVTDKAMPGMSGDQMAVAIKRVAPGMPIILLTGFGHFHDKEDFPCINVLASKPIRIPALREAIATAMQAA
ncbi:MAG: ATP-binding protein [Chthoniobacteraceae bacterium]